MNELGKMHPVSSEDPSDADIERLLQAAPEERWAELWEAVAALDAEDDHGQWAGASERGQLQLPYVVYSEAVERTSSCIFALGASLPFDWPTWDGLRRYPGGRGLEAAPVAEAVRMVTAVVRADRFSEGTILAALGDGTLAAAIGRLRRWHDEER